MALNPLIINKNYFGGVQARGDFIKAGDLDRQFVTISSYINKFIVPTLNQLISSQIPGSNNPVDANKNLINVGDGTTKWDFPKAEYIPDYSLSLNKLVQANPGSILATDNNQIFRAVSPSSGGLALTARVQNTPIWKKIVGNDSISNRVITSEKIALMSLIASNFNVNLDKTYTRTLLINNVIEQNTISTNKIANEAINENIFSQIMTNMFCGINGSKAALWGNTLNDNIINNTSYLENNLFSPVIDHSKIDVNFQIPTNLYSSSPGYYAFTSENIADGAILNYNIKDNSLDGNRIFYGRRYSRQTPRPIAEMLKFGCIGVEQLPVRYRQKLGL